MEFYTSPFFYCFDVQSKEFNAYNYCIIVLNIFILDLIVNVILSIAL